MSKRVLVVAVILAVVPSLALAVQSRGRSKTGKMNVEVREVIVRVAPNYLSTKVGALTYGDQVNVIAKEGNWFQIESPGGWLPKGTLTKTRVKVNPDQKFSGKGTRHDEVALAGKGFNPQVEAQFKRSNRNLAAAYAAVDRVETYGATESELARFRAAGKLHAR